MASLTVRKLDEAIKTYLRLRSAKNGRSVEEEVRVILREYLEGRPAPDQAPLMPSEPPAPAPRDGGARAEARVTLIIGGGIAAYKALDLIRRLKERHIHVRCVLTRAAQQFVTPLSASALSGGRVYTDLFDPDGEFDAGHIRLARDCDLIVVAPATADLMAKMAQGHADDLATAVLLAASRPILLAPAMNPMMWSNAATRRNVAQLARDSIAMVGPNAGEMAEAGEAGVGRMAEPLEIVAAAERVLRAGRGPRRLAGKRVLITAGPTHEPIDPVRYIANRSSGKQGHAIARAAAELGARVTLLTGPVTLPDPQGIDVVHVETAAELLGAVQKAMPADIAVFAAAVADWRTASTPAEKIKKSADRPHLDLVENPDILATVGRAHSGRPTLVIGFAAETQSLTAEAVKKRKAKGADWIVANDVSPARGVFGGDANTVQLVTAEGTEDWPPMSKDEVARRLMQRAAEHLRRGAAAAE
jgi:phosphopantothenoylcysteine decarboxylase / phosphopantothenate---cysteine ligase